MGKEELRDGGGVVTSDEFESAAHLVLASARPSLGESSLLALGELSDEFWDGVGVRNFSLKTFDVRRQLRLGVAVSGVGNYEAVHIAAFYGRLLNNPGTAASCLAFYTHKVLEGQQKKDVYLSDAVGFMDTEILPFGPEELGLPRTTMTRQGGNVHLFRWYKREGVEDILKRADTLYRLRTARRIANADASFIPSLRVAASAALSRESRDRRHDPEVIVTALRECSPERARSVISEFRGVRAKLSACRADATPEEMRKALHAIATQERTDALTYLGRAPTFGELETVLHYTGGLFILTHLPWVYAGPLIEKHEVELRAALLQHADKDYNTLSKALVDHPGRRTLYQEKITEPKEWFSVWEPIAEAYRYARSWRSSFSEVAGPATRVMAIQHHLGAHVFPPETAKFLHQHPNWGAIEDHIERCPAIV